MANSALDIDINNIFYQLHKIAIDEALKVSNDIELQNLGVDDKKENFIGAGEFGIVARAKDAQKDIPDKSIFVEAIKKYVEFFIGKDLADKINADDCKSLDIEVTKTESMHYDARKPMLENLFMLEATDDTALLTVGYMLLYNVEIEGSKKQNFDGLLRYRLKNGGKNLLVGVAKVGGIAVKALWPGIKAFGKGVFGGILQDIGNIKVHTGSGDIDVGGKIKDIAGAAKDTAVGTAKAAISTGWDAIKSLYNNVKKTIFGPKDIEQIKSDLDSLLHKDFPDNKAQVLLYKSSSLISELKRQKLFTAELSLKLNKLEYCLAIQVKSIDLNYPQYSKKSIAKVFTKAFGKYTNWFFKGKLSEDNIIKIANFKTDIKNKRDRLFNKYKDEDIYDSINTKNNILNLLFENNRFIILESKLDDLKQDLLDYLFKSLDASQRAKALDHLRNDSLVKDKDVEDSTGTYTTVISIINNILSKDESTARSLLASYDPVKKEKALSKMLQSVKYLEYISKIATLLAKLTDKTENAVLSSFKSDKSTEKLDDEDLKGTFSINLKGRSNKLKIAELFANAIQQFSGKIQDIKDFIKANYSPDSIYAIEKIYNSLNSIFLKVTGQILKKYSEDLYIIDKNIDYNKDPHQQDDTKGKK